MLRKTLVKKKIGAREEFHWRGEEISRIEGLSDAVFAFAVTLLIVSLEVPKTFSELTATLWGFGAFAACFAQLMYVWYQQYIYYRRYNLQDAISTVLSMTLLFVVLFFTYPLKFVFSAWLVPHAPGMPAPIQTVEQYSAVFTIYGIGYMTVFSVFALMYLNAWRSRETLGLTPLEIHDTVASAREMVMAVGVGGISVAIANLAPPNLIGIAGPSYALMGPVMSLHAYWSSKRRAALEKQLALSASDAAPMQTEPVPETAS